MLACWVNFSGGLVTAKFRALRLAQHFVMPFFYRYPKAVDDYIEFIVARRAMLAATILVLLSAAPVSRFRSDPILT